MARWLALNCAHPSWGSIVATVGVGVTPNKVDGVTNALACFSSIRESIQTPLHIPDEVERMQHYFTTAEVAERYRTASSTVRYWRHIGYGPKGAKVGRRYLYPETAIREFDEALLASTTGNREGAEEQLPGHLDANAGRVTSHQR